MKNKPEIPSAPSVDGAESVLPRHLYLLDALRGVAALAVVLWHWQHFFYGGPNPEGFQREQQPFFRLFRLCYDYGWWAVDLFFCLSGFIFFWLYADSIAQQLVPLRRFAVLRLSRLYPLHLITLLFVAVAQALFLRWFGRYFVFQNNDGYHFALQSVLASNWGLERGFSFNGPIWSVSVEVLLYAVFWVLCRLGWRHAWQLAVLVCVGCLMLRYGNEMVGRGLIGFFSGGLVLGACRFAVQRGLTRQVLTCLGCVMIAGLAGLFLLFQTHLFSTSHAGGRLDPELLFKLRTQVVVFAPKLILFPLMILTLVLWEVQAGGLGSRLAFLGQISYSSYLLHFPLQMVFVATARSLAVPTAFFYSPVSLFLFFGLLIPLSLLSFHRFELPCQRWLRARFLPKLEKG